MFHLGHIRHILVALLLFTGIARADSGPALGENLLGPAGFDFSHSEPGLSLASDFRQTPKRLWQSLRSIPDRDNLPVFALGAGWSYVASAGWDFDVRREMKENGRRLGGANDLFSIAGHPAAHMGFTALVYSTSLLTDDRRLHDLAVDLFDAFVITDVSNFGLKYMFDSERPNGQPYGFPSGHTASSFAFASIVHQHYGMLPGAAAYGLAGLVGWHRVDDQKHELSDVLAGALIGYLVGTSVTGQKSFLSGNPRVVPYSSPHGGAGVAIDFRF